MEIEQRDKIAAIMFDIKHKIKDGEYKEIMDILGKKEAEPNLENIRMVKLTYIECTYKDPTEFMDHAEHDTFVEIRCHSDDMEGNLKFSRLNQTMKTKIVEVYGTEDRNEYEDRYADLGHSRIHIKSLQRLMDRVKTMRDANIRNATPYMVLTESMWIYPLKCDILSKK